MERSFTVTNGRETANVTVDAPDWALDGGFPEDLPTTHSSELPSDAVCVEEAVFTNTRQDDEHWAFAIFVSKGKNYKVSLKQIEEELNKEK